MTTRQVRNILTDRLVHERMPEVMDSLAKAILSLAEVERIELDLPFGPPPDAKSEEPSTNLN